MNERDMVAALARQNLYYFIIRAFGILENGDNFVPNWHIELLADRLMRVDSGEIKRLLILLPPRNLKSFCASVAFPAWFMGRRPHARIVCASYANELSGKLARDSRTLIQSDWYRQVFPTRLNPDKCAESEFETTRGGYRLSTSVGGTLTGRGANLIIIDDPIKPADVQSVPRRTSVKEWFDATVLSRLDNKKDDAIVVVMQRLHVDDLAAHLDDKGGWDVLRLPAIAERNENFRLLDGSLVGRRRGDPLNKAREDLAVLESIRKSMGSFQFSAQYLQAPVPPAGNIVKRSWLRTYDVEPTWTKGDEIIQSWDVATTGGDDADWSVCTTWLRRKSEFYLLDVLRARLEFPDLKRTIVSHATKFHRPVILVEDAGIGTGLIQQLRSEGKVHVISVRPQGSKLDRMVAESAIIEAGSLHLPRQASWLDTYLTEMLAFPAVKNDDQVDSTSQALNWTQRPRAGLFGGSAQTRLR